MIGLMRSVFIRGWPSSHYFICKLNISQVQYSYFEATPVWHLVTSHKQSRIYYQQTSPLPLNLTITQLSLLPENLRLYRNERAVQSTQLHTDHSLLRSFLDLKMKYKAMKKYLHRRNNMSKYKHLTLAGYSPVQGMVE